MKKHLLILLSLIMLLLPMNVFASEEYPLAEVYDSFGLGTWSQDKLSNYSQGTWVRMYQERNAPYRLDGPYLFLNTGLVIWGQAYADDPDSHMEFINLSGMGTTSESHIAAILAGKPYDTSLFYDKNVIATDMALADYMKNYLNSFDWKNSSETVRMKKAHEAIKKVPYMDDYNNLHVHDAYGALIEGRCVCQGYADAFHMMCRFTGLDVILIYDFNEGHNVNYVRADGKWYLQNNNTLGNIPVGKKHNYSMTPQQILTKFIEYIPEANRPYASRFF